MVRPANCCRAVRWAFCWVSHPSSSSYFSRAFPSISHCRVALAAISSPMRSTILPRPGSSRRSILAGTTLFATLTLYARVRRTALPVQAVRPGRRRRICDDRAGVTAHGKYTFTLEFRAPIAYHANYGITHITRNEAYILRGHLIGSFLSVTALERCGDVRRTGFAVARPERQALLVLSLAIVFMSVTRRRSERQAMKIQAAAADPFTPSPDDEPRSLEDAMKKPHDRFDRPAPELRKIRTRRFNNAHGAIMGPGTR